MDIKDICNAGGDILDAVADAVSRNDYSGLSDHVSNTVNRVVRQVRDEVSRGTYGNPTHQYAKTVYTRKGQAEYERIHKKDGRDGSKYASIYKKGPIWAGKKPDPAAKREIMALPAAATKRPAGRVLGPVQLAWGILATCGFGITALVMAIMAILEGGTAAIVMAAVFAPLTLLGITDIVRGSHKIGLVNRFYLYARLIGERGYIAIEELAFQSGQRKEEVLRDLRKMMKKHMFPQGRLDNRQTTFMLTQDVYQQYLQTEQDRQAREGQLREGQAGRVQQDADAKAAKDAKEEASHRYDEQTRKILQDGNAYIRMVHECNEKIRGEEMSYKLSKLESIMRRIFEQVERVPESADDLHKFMDYYLPTTTKLLHAYIDLDRQEIAGENIVTTKREIEDTLDTINIAFEKLLDGLFEDTAWDISSDISVMKTMMAQEGLTGERDFYIQ